MDYTAKERLYKEYRLSETSPYSLRHSLVLRSADYFNAGLFPALPRAVVACTEAALDRVVIFTEIAVACRQHMLLIASLGLSPIQRIAVHGDLMEAKVVVNRQFLLHRHTERTLGPSLGVSPTSKCRHRIALVADELHSVVPVDKYLAEVGQEDHLIEQWLRHSQLAHIAVLHSIKEFFVLHLAMLVLESRELEPFSSFARYGSLLKLVDVVPASAFAHTVTV